MNKSACAHRRFPAPWTVDRIPGGYRIDDANGVAVAYVYGRDGPLGASDTRLTMDEARRIAAGIAWLPKITEKADG